MPPRTLSQSAARIISNQQRTPSTSYPLRLQFSARRCLSQNDKPLPKADQPGPGPNQQQLPHVSEEAATMGKITGEQGPELDKGTPVEEILKRDPTAKDKAPDVLKPRVGSDTPKGSRSYSTTTRRHQEEVMIPIPGQTIEGEGHKFGLPALPLHERAHLKFREDPVVHQVTQLLIKDGKKSVAQRNMVRILNHLRTTGPPKFSSERPLLPNAPSPSHLPLNPILYLTLAIDSVAPVLRIKSYRGLAGGGTALQIPIPLAVKQRRRTAVKWILDAANKKSFKGSGSGGLAQKIAEELIAIVEGKSSVWERRGGIHKLGVAARSNLGKLGRPRGGRR